MAPSLSSTSPSSLYAPSNNFHSSGNSLHERESDGISLYSEGPSSLGMYEQSMASNGGGGGGASSINANPKEAQRSQETILLKRRREIDLLRKAHYGCVPLLMHACTRIAFDGRPLSVFSGFQEPCLVGSHLDGPERDNGWHGQDQDVPAVSNEPVPRYVDHFR